MNRLVRFGLGVVALLLVVGLASNSEQFTAGERQANAPAVLPIEAGFSPADAEAAEEPNEPIELPASIVGALAVAGCLTLLWLLWRQRISSWRPSKPSLHISTGSDVAITEEAHAEQAAEFARDLIDELNEGDSPRYAIQRAYAAVETGFGAPELVRKPAETPLRYLDRIFGRHATLKEPLSQLTDLFQRARYSSEVIDETMRADAIAALTEIRAHYVNVAWRKISRSRSKATT